jgi:hypothetical protein
MRIKWDRVFKIGYADGNIHPAPHTLRDADETSQKSTSGGCEVRHYKMGDRGSTRKELIEKISKKMSPALKDKYGGTIRQMKKKQLELVDELVFPKTLKGDFT